MITHKRVLLSDTVSSVEQMLDLLPVTDRPVILRRLLSAATQDERAKLIALSTEMYQMLVSVVLTRQVEQVEVMPEFGPIRLYHPGAPRN